jgi:hypothetical protein
MVQSKWEEWQDEQIDQMSKAIDKAQQSMGQAHRQAADQTEHAVLIRESYRYLNFN